MDTKNNFLNIDKSLSINNHQQGLLADNGTLHTNDYNNLRISSRSSFNLRNSDIPDSAGNTLNTARRIAVDSTTDTYNDFVGRADRNDYYTFNLNNSSNFSLSLHTQSASVNFQLLDSKGERIQSSTSTETPEDSMSLHLNTGTYYIRVFSNPSTQNTPYQLDLTATQITPLPSTTETGYRSVEYKDGFSGISSIDTNQSPMSADAPIKDPLLGVYYGNQGWNMNQVKAMETWQGKKNAVVNMFTNWASDTTTIDNLFNQQLLNIWNNKNIPMISWEPYAPSNSTPDNIEVQIVNGEFDVYINTWADKLKTFLSGTDGVYNTADDRRAYLRFAHEMNGDWYSWSAAKGGNSPTDYVNMWRHTKDIFDAKGMDASRLQWVWSVNNTDEGGFTAEQYYPGDNYGVFRT